MKFGNIKDIKGDILFRCRVEGDSMLPLIKNGDIIRFKRVLSLEKGDIIIYKSWNDKVVCHRLVNINNKYILTKGDNCWYNDFRINKNSVIGKVINIKQQRYKKLLTILSKMNILKLYNKGGLLWKRLNERNQLLRR